MDQEMQNPAASESTTRRAFLSFRRCPCAASDWAMTSGELHDAKPLGAHGQNQAGTKVLDHASFSTSAMFKSGIPCCTMLGA